LGGRNLLVPDDHYLYFVGFLEGGLGGREAKSWERARGWWGLMGRFLDGGAGERGRARLLIDQVEV
jgi:hypothetical protein